MIHIAGQPVQVGSHLRQRCAWCGTLLEQYDLQHIAVPIEDVGKPLPMWEVNALVEVIEGNPTIKHIVPHVDGDQIPFNCCAQIDHDVTM